MANRIARSFSQASRRSTEIKALLLTRSEDLRCFNLMCSKVGEPCICRLHRVLERLPNLEELCLASNSLTSLPPSLWDCASLQKLDLSHNDLSALPHELGKLQRLQRLDVRGNPQLTSLPKVVAEMPLLRMVLSDSE